MNENLKRKRIYLEREKFDIMSVLKHSINSSEKKEQSQNSKKRPASPRDSNCMSTLAGQSTLGLGNQVIKGPSVTDENSID